MRLKSYLECIVFKYEITKNTVEKGKETNLGFYPKKKLYTYRDQGNENAGNEER